MSLTIEPVNFRDMPCVRLRNDAGATALVALHGAQVLSWIPADGRERLFLSERAHFAEGAAIRGGVPVIFPQFAGRGPLPKHGFARTLPWRFLGADERASFELTQSTATAIWPHTFSATLHIGLDASALDLTLGIRNTGEDAFTFTAALHTYLAIGDLDATVLRGLADRHYEDSAVGGVHRPHDGNVLRFDGGELDRLYAGPTQPLELRDGERCMAIAQRGFADTVVWNPGAALASSLSDLAPGDHRRFVCVEAAQVVQPVSLPPGAGWSGTQRLG